MNSLKAKKIIKKKAIKPSTEKSLRTLLRKGPIMSEAQFEAFIKTREQFETWKGK